MKLLTENTSVFINDNRIYEILEFKRNVGRDKLCVLEDTLIKTHKYCHWLLDEIKIVEDENLKFLNNHDIKYNLIPFITLPFDITNKIDIVKSIWQLYFEDDYYKETNFDKGDVSLPSGYLSPKYIFIGEAPSKSRLPNNMNTYYNTMTRVYTQGKNCLLFRILSNIIFGSQNWYTNMFKCGVFPEDKILDQRLINSLNYLKLEINLLKTDTIICLGNFVYNSIIQSELFKEHKIYKIFHPSYIMRNGNDIELYKNNMKEIFRRINE